MYPVLSAAVPLFPQDELNICVVLAGGGRRTSDIRMCAFFCMGIPAARMRRSGMLAPLSFCRGADYSGDEEKVPQAG